MSTVLRRIYNRILLTPHLSVNKLSFYFSEDITNYSSTRVLLSTIKDIHSQKRCFLIGNGPSVRLADLEFLKNEITFCCNRFHLCYRDTSFRPTYIVSADDFMIKDFGMEISKSAIENNQKAFFGMVKDPRPYITNDDSIFWIRLNRDRPFKPSPNISKSIGNGGATLLFAAQIALFMGLNEIYLYGVDHNFKNYQTSKTIKLNSAHGDGNHFIENYRSGRSWVPPSTSFSEASYKSMSEYLDNIGGFLRNASRKSALPYIERVNFDSIIK